MLDDGEDGVVDVFGKCSDVGAREFHPKLISAAKSASATAYRLPRVKLLELAIFHLPYNNHHHRLHLFEPFYWKRENLHTPSVNSKTD